MPKSARKIFTWTPPAGRVALLCAALAVLAPGCATRPDSIAGTSGIDVPAQWSGSGGAGSTPDIVAKTEVDTARWWQHFNDPLLTTLVTDALAHSPDLRSAKAVLAQARARRTAERSGWFPTLNAGAAAQRNDNSGTRTDRYSAGLDASWEPDLFGATRHGVDAADEDVAASTATLQATQVALAAEVALAYVDLRSFQARRDIAAQNLVAQDETVSLTGWRAEAGLASSLDTEQARTNHGQTRAQLAALDNSLAVAEHRLAVLCGKPPTALHDLLAPRQPVPRTESTALVGIPADTLRQRPDVRAAEAQLRAESARTDAKRAVRWPNLTIAGSVGVASATASGLTAGGAATSSLLANLTLPLFDAGRRRAEVAAQLAVREQSLASYQGVVLGALEDVENALTGIATSRERVDALRGAAEAANNAALLAQHRYTAGSIDFQALLDTQRTALAVADGLAAASADEAAAQIRLYKALGGGWQTDESSNTGTPAP